MDSTMARDPGLLERADAIVFFPFGAVNDPDTASAPAYNARSPVEAA